MWFQDGPYKEAHFPVVYRKRVSRPRPVHIIPEFRNRTHRHFLNTRALRRCDGTLNMRVDPGGSADSNSREKLRLRLGHNQQPLISKLRKCACAGASAVKILPDMPDR